MPLLSVIVPTHNRAVYAVSCIEAVLAYTDADLELIVTDTSTDGKLGEFLEQEGAKFLDDHRLKYSFIQYPSNLTKNHNDAVALATGEFICIIGDDDCITQGAIDAARWASDNSVQVISQAVATTYAWPDFRSQRARNGHAGRLYVPRKLGSARWRNAHADLQASLVNAFQGTHEMPRCYHGVVRRDLMERLSEQTGAYFHGSSPDMSGSVALSNIVDTYLEVDMPLTIPGVSGGSNSGRSAMNTHKGDLASESQTSGFDNEAWTPGVPRFFSVETVWAHAGLETLSKLRPDLIDKFNFERLVGLCRLQHPEYSNRCDTAAEELALFRGQKVEQAIRAEIRVLKWAKRKALAKRLLIPTVSNGRKYFSGLKTISAARTRYERYADSKGLSFGHLDKERSS
ncbi:glycosyltransferase [Altererythrobacter sp.]|nr:glycosyltransferase [Altererythrobacter sp.]